MQADQNLHSAFWITKNARFLHADNKDSDQLVGCVKVLRPSQPIKVMSSVVSLPNHIFSWAGLVVLAINQYL